MSRSALLTLAAAVLVTATVGAAPPATLEEARRFVEDAETRLLALSIESQRADWVKSTFITDDTETLAAQANQRRIAATTELAKRATRFDGLTLPADVARKLLLLKVSLDLPAPPDERKAEELTRIVAGMEGTYGKGKWCRKEADGKDHCLDLEDLSRIMASSRDEKELREVWAGWHTISPPMRKDFARYVELGNEGARGLGFKDMGAVWRSRYDMPADEFTREVDRLWGQVRPLYESLHAYVRRRLRETYGAQAVPERGPIPAHLLGNMWAQQWGNVYPLVAPKDADPGFDLTERLKGKGVSELEMVRYGERFFQSLGFAALPKTFWERSLFVKPRDRDVVCHASAWDIDFMDDLRIKMCIEITGEDFSTIHHELGHNFYQRAYKGQPFFFRDSANDGFHEAIGDTIALSITPAYLVKVGLLDKEPDTSKDIGLLLQMALEKIAFLPFGLLVDQWRWKAFSGEITPADYNAGWWRLRQSYQGVAPPVPRSESDFDPGAKYHVAANVPYTRYFLAHILQFQFHRALCQAAGQTGPLNRCSIYGSQEAGRRLQRLLEMGLSRPWPDALEALTGQRQMDATAIMDYFAPLKKWLDQQNAGQPVGW
ncbi:MAG TPA: M2 family metallopeptidase [Vicinamibacteria bacterium]|jgi:peptidyl-dipeptidase A|nr:M2 family metallopeptidase [Vicinamibacteria bacterium]